MKKGRLEERVGLVGVGGVGGEGNYANLRSFYRLKDEESAVNMSGFLSVSKQLGGGYRFNAAS